MLIHVHIDLLYMYIHSHTLVSPLYSFSKLIQSLWVHCKPKSLTVWLISHELLIYRLYKFYFYVHYMYLFTFIKRKTKKKPLLKLSDSFYLEGLSLICFIKLFHKLLRSSIVDHIPWSLAFWKVLQLSFLYQFSLWAY